jgi:hypothetical protein
MPATLYRADPEKLIFFDNVFPALISSSWSIRNDFNDEVMA